jgi:hypothetical protein
MAKLFLNKGRDPALRKLGLGDNATLDQVVKTVRDATNAAIYAMPTIAKREWHFGGPIKTNDVVVTLGDTIDILGGEARGVDEIYETTGLNEGEFQTWVVACAFAIHLQYSPECFAVRGNAFTRPASPFTPIAKPFSPDAWTVKDQAEWAANGAVAPTSPADLDYGTPAGNAFWALVRAYDLMWSYGSNYNIANQQLREFAYMPPSPQEGSASSSQIWVPPYAREVNDRYNNLLGSGSNFTLCDTLRIGDISATGPSGSGRFVPSRDFEYVGVTYGGPDLRAKIGIGANSEFASLTNPFLLRPGVKIGMKMLARDALLQKYFQNQFDVQAGFGGLTPPVFTESADYLTTAGSAFTERSIDAADQTQQVIGGRAYWKGFNAFMSNEIRGWEINDPLANAIMNNPTLAARLCSDCGCMVGWPS